MFGVAVTLTASLKSSLGGPCRMEVEDMKKYLVAALAAVVLAGAGCSAQAVAADPTPAPATTSPSSSPTPSPTTATPSPTAVNDGGYEAGYQDGYQYDVIGDPVPEGHSPEYAAGWEAAQKVQDKELQEYVEAEKKALRPHIKDLREGWPQETKPYSNDELGDALSSQCYIELGDYWDLDAWNEARLKDAKTMGIKNKTLRHAILGQAAGKNGYCDYS